VAKLHDLLGLYDRKSPPGTVAETLEQRRERIRQRRAEGKGIRAMPGEERWLQRRCVSSLFGEMQAVEGFARILTECPNVPWELKKKLARITWDEARHMEVYMKMIPKHGARLDEEPDAPFMFALLRDPDPAIRLVSARAGEGLTLDMLLTLREEFEKLGMPEWSRCMDYLLADEVSHFRIMGQGVDTLTSDSPEHRERVDEYRRKLTRAIHKEERGTVYKVAQESREVGGATSEEMQEAKRFQAESAKYQQPS